MRTLRYILPILTISILTGFDDIDFQPLPKIKVIKEWREWADKSKSHESDKWLKSKREYYTNGNLKSRLFLDYKGDTTGMTIYELGKDSLIVKETWYNTVLKKWMKGDKYKYEKGDLLPYLTESKDGYKCFYKYDKDWNIIERRHIDDKNLDFGTFEFIYDSTGLLIQEIEYDFFGSEKFIKRQYVYEYEKDSFGKVIKQDKYFVPSSDKETEIKTNDKGEQMTIYRGYTAKMKSIIETLYFNQLGERVKMIEYDRDDKPQFIRTYEYEYYK